MDERIKLSVLGGSGVATPGLIQSLVDISDRPGVEITLIGRTVDKLEAVSRLCQRLAEKANDTLTVTHTTDLKNGLTGADYVLNQIRVGGYEARAHDEAFPQEFGIPGEETFGPGGMNYARRTIPVTLEHCKVIEQVCPDALLVNLTNPSSFIQYAVSQYTDVDVIGVCNSPTDLGIAIANLVGAPPSEVWVGYIGMHHFGWITEASWNGKDIMPEVMSRIDGLPGLPVDAEIVRAMGAVPTPYYKYYYHADRMLEKQRGKPTRAQQLMGLQDEILDDLMREDLDQIPKSLRSRGAGWYEEIIVPVMLAHTMDTREVFTLNVSNGTAVPWMPADAIVELPVVVTRQGFYPLQPPHAPEDIKALIRLNATFEVLWVEAVVENSYEKALRAMMLNHLVSNLDQARGILEEIWPKE
jgi:6-phospho-beta-glucosidase